MSATAAAATGWTPPSADAARSDVASAGRTASPASALSDTADLHVRGTPADYDVTTVKKKEERTKRRKRGGEVEKEEKYEKKKRRK